MLPSRYEAVPAGSMLSLSIWVIWPIFSSSVICGNRAAIRWSMVKLVSSHGLAARSLRHCHWSPGIVRRRSPNYQGGHQDTGSDHGQPTGQVAWTTARSVWRSGIS